ncbi:MAG TPA: hypothetical protein VFZ49_00870 [Pyrinomonadaceae bacterium]
MKRIPVSILLLFAAFGLSCAESANTNVAVNAAVSKATATPVVHQDDGHDAPRISLADAKKHFDEEDGRFH